MNKLYVINFSRSEYAMHASLFKALCPSCVSEHIEKCGLQDKEFSKTDCALIGCAADEKNALESLLLAKEKNLRATLYAERKPSALFLSIVQGMENSNLLICPESVDEARQCACFSEKGKRYVSKAAQRKDETGLLGKFVSLDSLSEMNRLLVFGIAEGLSLKEMQSLTGRGERYIQTCLQRLKKRFNVLERRELFTALIKWISLDAGAPHTG